MYLLFAAVTRAGQHCDAEARVDVPVASGDLQLEEAEEKYRMKQSTKKDTTI